MIKELKSARNPSFADLSLEEVKARMTQLLSAPKFGGTILSIEDHELEFTQLSIELHILRNEFEKACVVAKECLELVA